MLNKFILALSYLLIFPVTVAHASTLTVNPGQSIQSAVNSASPGDIVQVRAGTYNERVSISKSITVTGYIGERPVIDGQGTRSEGIAIEGNNITVANFKVTNHTGHDVEVDESSFVTLDNLEVYVTGRAVHIQESNNITVKNCTITTPTELPKQTDGIYSQRNKNNIYENNTIIIYNKDETGHNDAIQMYQDDSIIVRGNYLAQVNDKIKNAQGLYATTMYGLSKFYNNVINLGNAQSNALTFRRFPSLGGTGSVEIVNNTVFTQRAYHGIWVEDVEVPVIQNNISYLINTKEGEALTLAGSIASKAKVTNNLISGDPKFVNMNNFDFHLLSNSPAINAGISLGSPYDTDKDGKTRPQGSAWDIGAYEYGSGLVSPTPTPTPSPSTRKLGDANGDNTVDEIDYNIWRSKYGQNVSGASNGNFDGNGLVDGIDYVIMVNNYGK